MLYSKHDSSCYTVNTTRHVIQQTLLVMLHGKHDYHVIQ